MKNKIILVTGWYATGKSTFAERLAERLSVPFFNKDVINETIGDALGAETCLEIYNKKGGNPLTFSILAHIAERFLQVGEICILESNFYKPEIEKIKNLLEKYDYKCLTYMFKGDIDVLGERFISRGRERHWVHGKPNLDDMKRSIEHRERMDVEIGQMVYVDATSFEKIDYEALFTNAKKFIDNG